MPVRSAGVLLHRGGSGATAQVLIAHPGGPLWARRDDGAWSVPKGEYGPEEDPWAAAQREFAEEVGSLPPVGPRRDLGEIRQRSGKIVRVFAVAGELDAAAAVSNTFAMVWPPRSGRVQHFPEVDRVAWFTVAAAREKLVAGQRGFLDRLAAVTGQPSGGGAGGGGR